jgi:hypothetical protein
MEVNMIGKKLVALPVGLLLVLAATSGLALAQPFGGHGGRGGHQMWLLARAAGLTHSQISTAFQNDSNLATDRANLKSAHQAMMTCLVAGNCTNQVASFATAQQTLTQERMTVWQNLLKGAPNLSQAASVYSQLQQLQATKKSIFQSVFGSQGSTPPNG